jgi:hypothetical protein
VLKSTVVCNSNSTLQQQYHAHLVMLYVVDFLLVVAKCISSINNQLTFDLPFLVCQDYHGALHCAKVHKEWRKQLHGPRKQAEVIEYIEENIER